MAYDHTTDGLPIHPDSGAEAEPWHALSAGQRSLWFQYGLHPESQAEHNSGLCVRARGRLDVARLAGALRALVARHPMLAAEFAEIDGEPVQRIRHGAEPRVLRIDARNFSAQRLSEAVREDFQRPFDLHRPALVRASVYEIAQDEAVLLLAFDHIVCDGWSFWLALDDLGALLAVAADDAAAQQRAESRIAYFDYVAAQQQALAGDMAQRQWDFWRGQLDKLPVLELPTDRPRPRTIRYRGASFPFALSPALTAQIRVLAASTAGSMYSTLLASFQILLQRLSGQDEVVLGTAMPARGGGTWDRVVGDFVNAVVLRADLSERPAVRTVLRAARDKALLALKHQDFPFSELVHRSGIARDSSRHALFQVSFVLQNARHGKNLAALMWSGGDDVPPVRWGGLDLTSFPMSQQQALFDLTLETVDLGDRVVGEFKYNTDLFDAATIERMAGHFSTLLAAMVEQPAARIDELPLLSSAGREQVLVTFNDTAADSPRGLCVHEMFEQQAARAPDAMAVLFEDQGLTYAQLNARANRLAHHLRRLGVGPDVLVAICSPRCIEMMVGLLAILKAGGAYVPIDPGYPADRIAFMLEDAAPKVVLTLESLDAALPATAAPRVWLDRADTICAGQPATDLPASTLELAPHHLAYVIYTSGSTGKPKGVMVEHRQLVNCVASARQAYQLRAGERVLQFVSISFDVATEQIFSALDRGAALVLRDEETAQGLQGLRRACDRHAIGVVVLPAAFWGQLMADLEAGADCWPRSVRLVVIGGEAASRQARATWSERVSADCTLLNAYGPTETTVVVARWPVERDIDAQAGTMPIGRPVANTQIYILDPQGQPVPIGVAAEIFIGGAQVARGYLNRAELTAERFVPDPFSAEPGARMYRTGDLARWLANGAIEYLGRVDEQVKIRGFRIEPGEIESVLVRHPSVREAVVIAREDAGSDKRLVAYVVGRDAPPAVSELRVHVQSQLPDYMVPAAFVMLQELPLTPNGKVDRKALPAPDLSASGHSFVAPRTPVEEVLTGIWSEVLHIERVGVHDNFFELGGHSLLATQVLGRLRSVFGVELPVHALFEAPTVEALARQVDVALRGQAPAEAPLLLASPRTGELPLSFAQQGLWFLDQLEQGSAFYNTPAAVRLTGPLDLSALGRGIREIARRHEALRTSFPSRNGQPRQEIAGELAWSMPVVEVQEAEVLQRAMQEAAKPFDLARGPLLRTTVLRLSAQEHVLLLTMHHIVSDGWSTGVLVRELAALYEAFSAGRPSPLSELPIQYPDYAAWQRTWLRGDVLGAQLAYWKQQLAGAPAALDLPTDRPRPAVQTYRGASYPVALPRELSQRLAAFSRREGVTPFMTLLAAFQILLRRYTGQDDIVVGSPIAGRTQAQTEGLIGCFVNTLVLRTDLSGEPSARELLARVREVTLGAYAHQDLPFEMLVKELAPQRDLSRSPLFQVMLALQNARVSISSLGEVKFAEMAVPNTTAKFELALALEESGEGLQGALEYNTDLFDHATIARMVGHFATLLTGMVEHPEACIDERPLMNEVEREQVLEGFNETAVDFPRDLCVHALFEQQAARTPRARAVVFGEQSLSYAQLDARANQLAHCLRGLGVGPGVLVAICVERSVEMVVGLLAILKAGGAYVPIDPAYPPDRIAFMVEDAAPRVVLTQASLAAALPSSSAVVVQLDADTPPWQNRRRSRPDSGATATDLAYVIYTSGSTGKPKGVMIEHCGVINLALAQRAAFGVTAASRVLQFASFSFDASAWEVVMALCNGAELHLPQPGVVLTGAALTTMLRQSGITHLTLPPVVLAALGDDGALPDSVQTLIVAGEASSAALVQRWGKGRRYFNAYGPTEATVCATWHECRPETMGDGPVPIGHPIPNVRCHVLDARLRPVPIGVPGELYIGGEGLARGYLHRPALTAERFIADPFTAAPGARLYRTGDLARWRANGNIEYLGRIDHQVKIRGFRIELGEIESVLAQHASVGEAVVVAREDVPGHKRLVAYVVGRDALPDVSALRAHLQGQLPDYMVPSAFVELQELPLTPNGKVDRKALPAPELSTSGQGFVAPRTPVEEVLAGIWSEVLHIERVGVHDNFFELGGHSLLATQVLGRLRPAFGVEVPLRALFEAPTVAGFAQQLQAAMRGEGACMAPALAPMPRRQELPLSFAQQRLWFLDQLQPGSAFYNIPGAVRLTGRLDVSALERSFSEIVRRHEALRTSFAVTSGQARQGIAAGLACLLPVIDVPEADLLQRAEEEACKPFDLVTGPLLRTTLLRLSAQEHVLLVTMHHIVSDGWSMGVLVRELAALYEAFSTGQPSPLPQLPIQYADYAAWQRQWLSGQVLDAQLAYWKQQLAGAPAALELPTDRPRPAVQAYRGAVQPVALPKELSQELAALSRREGVTLFMTLLAAFQMLLSRYTGQHDIVVGSPIAGRTQAQTEGLIGFFVNTLVLRTDLSGAPTARELLARVREVTLGAYAHQDVPFEKLVEELAPRRDMSRSPLFQVMLVLQNAPMEAASLGEVQLAPVELPHTTSKFELTLMLEEGDEGLRGGLEYNTDLFDAATIARMTGHFTTLLCAMVEHPEAGIDELPLLTQAERDQVLVDFNATAADFPRQLCVHELFEQQVARTPDATAVVLEERRLSYRELEEQANQLAHHLRGLGVGPDVLVAICVERSLEMVVGLLAILKAGGAYVPVDPDYPSERIAHMFEDCAPKVVLTQNSLADMLPAGGAQVVRVDADAPAWQDQPRTVPQSGVAATDLAYVIFTSGSTGRPKGAMVPHRGFVNLMGWYDALCFDRAAEEAVLMLSNFSFDLTQKNVFTTLARGARLVLPAPGLFDSRTVCELIERRGVSVINLTPSVFVSLLQDGDVGRLRSLRTVVLGGEPIPYESLRQWHRESGCRLVNSYGPTECTDVSSYWVQAPSDDGALRVPLGIPVPNVHLYVLDEHMAPVPLGVAGELWIGGVGVGRGYLGRDDLTAQRFVANPFHDPADPASNERLYRTGDLARRESDGTLQYLGRLDHQVKIRGFRIELGEIESVLMQHPSVREAVVVAREDVPGDKRLVAYLVAGDAQPETSELRRHLKGQLPEYMVPSAFVVLEAMPLTPNGKADRKALPAPGFAVKDQAFVAPRTPVEEVLAGIWSQVLNIERVGVHDNFFELGGHSLLAVQMVARVRKELGVELPLAVLFQHPTVKELALALPVRNAAPQHCLVPIAPHGDGSPLFVVHPMGGDVLCYADLARALGDAQPVYGLRAVGLDGRQVPLETVEQMADRYLRELRGVQPVGPYFLAGYSFGGLIAYEMAHQLESAGESVALLALLDTSKSFPARSIVDDFDVIDVLFGKTIECDLAALRGMPRTDALRIVLKAVQEIGALPPDTDLDFTERLLKVVRANVLAAQAYRPPRYEGEVTLFVAAGEPRDMDDHETLGWSGTSGAGIRVHTLAATHMSMVSQPHVEPMAVLLRAAIARARFMFTVQPPLNEVVLRTVLSRGEDILAAHPVTDVAIRPTKAR